MGPCPVKFLIGYLNGATPFCVSQLVLAITTKPGGHGGRVVTLSPPTSEAGVRSLSRPYVGKLEVTCRWSAVYSTEP